MRDLEGVERAYVSTLSVTIVSTYRLLLVKYAPVWSPLLCQ